MAALGTALADGGAERIADFWIAALGTAWGSENGGNSQGFLRFYTGFSYFLRLD